jgi:hypothetical protein
VDESEELVPAQIAEGVAVAVTDGRGLTMIFRSAVAVQPPARVTVTLYVPLLLKLLLCAVGVEPPLH